MEGTVTNIEQEGYETDQRQIRPLLERCLPISSKRHLNTKERKQKGAQKIAVMLFAQNSLLVTPCIIAIKKIIQGKARTLPMSKVWKGKR